jgi:tripartite-type tricarboxylate transporter receptor subunit TctC
MSDVREKLISQGLIMEKLSLAQFDQFIASDIKKLGQLVRNSGIQPE